jgi:hypothetical protein
MITIAAKDLPDGFEILRVCSKHMQDLVAELAAGKKCDVEAVEALLLLAEWEPQGLLSDVKEVGCGEEDRASWMHVGLALRIGYWLRLDRTSFRDEDEDKLLHSHRRRLAWACMCEPFGFKRLLTLFSRLLHRRSSYKRSNWQRSVLVRSEAELSNTNVESFLEPWPWTYDCTPQSRLSVLTATVSAGGRLCEYLTGYPRFDADFHKCSRCIILRYGK